MRLLIVVGAIALCSVLLFSLAGVGLAQAVDSDLWTTDGPVYAIVTDGNTLYFGGSFTQLATTTGTSVAIDASTGVVQRPYPQVSGFSVQAVAPDGSGGWYVGGDFTSVGGVPRNRLAHIDADGNLTPWNPNANNTVYAMTVSGNTVYVGGDFTIVGGQSRNRIAALDGTSGTASAWDPNANNRVDAFLVSGSTVYACGGFTNIGGQPRNRIVALDAASTGTATAWNPNSNSTVYALALKGDTLYVGGQFTNIGGQPRNRIAALDATSGAATAFNPNAAGTLEPGFSPVVYSLAVSGGTVYAGGNFTSILGSPRVGTAAMNAITGVPTAFDVGYTYGARALAVSGNTVYAGGGFNHIGGQARDGLAALDATTGAATAWNPGTYGYVAALAVSGNRVFVGGTFTSIVMARSSLAALDATGAATSWNPSANANGVVNTLALSGGTVYAGGNFTSIGGQLRGCIAALDATSGSATAWNPNAHMDALGVREVDALVVSGGTVYAGGVFDSIGGQPRNNLAALDVATGTATAWDPNVQAPTGQSATIHALLASEGTIYAGGDFTVVGGQPRNHIAAIDATSGAPTAWNPDASHTVSSLAMKGSDICAGGFFTHIGGEWRNYIAALDPVIGAATNWKPDANSAVLALTVNQGIVCAGGDFTTMAGQMRNHIAALDPVTGEVYAWDPAANGDVRTLAAVGAKVFLGGDFTTISGQGRPHIAGVTLDHLLSASRRETLLHSDLALLSANPSSGDMVVRYDVARAGRVRLELLDVSGRVEKTLVDRVHNSGSYVVSWDGVGRHGQTSPGLYFVRLVTSDQMTMRKLAIIQ